MTAPAVVFAVMAACTALSFAGGWVLRGLDDRYRAEVERDREFDAGRP